MGICSEKKRLTGAETNFHPLWIGWMVCCGNELSFLGQAYWNSQHAGNNLWDLLFQRWNCQCQSWVQAWLFKTYFLFLIAVRGRQCVGRIGDGLSRCDLRSMCLKILKGGLKKWYGGSLFPRTFWWILSSHDCLMRGPTAIAETGQGFLKRTLESTRLQNGKIKKISFETGINSALSSVLLRPTCVQGAFEHSVKYLNNEFSLLHFFIRVWK